MTDPLQNQRRDFFWLGFLVLVTASFWGLTWNTQPYLSSDDMGKDLYPFEMTLKGRWPCRDYYWQYGPLMLLYYGFWLRVGGIHLVSIRLGYSVLYLLSSILSYRTLRLFVSPPIAFLASLSFLIQGMVYPFYNFNHIGAILFLLFSIFSLWKYFLEGRIRWCYFGTLGLVGMALVKWNVGVTSFFAFLASLLLFRGLPKKGHSLLLILTFGTVVLGTYFVQYWGSQWDWVRGCVGMGQISASQGPWVNFKHLIQWFFVWDPKRLGWLGLFFMFGILGFLGWRKREWEEGERKTSLWPIGSVLSFGLLNSLDYFAVGHIYRLDFWSFPTLVLGMGLAAEWAKSLFGRKTRVFLMGLLFVGVLALPLRSVREAFRARVPERYLDFDRGRVYLVKETLSTIEVFKKGTHFILENTKPGQEILTLPKDPVYCFFSSRRHAGRELVFEQREPTLSEVEEEELIRELKVKEVPLVILANRDDSNSSSRLRGEGIGSFGKTHLKKLGRYVFENYEEVQSFGPWEARNPRIDHAIKILRKKGRS